MAKDGEKTKIVELRYKNYLQRLSAAMKSVHDERKNVFSRA